MYEPIVDDLLAVADNQLNAIRKLIDQKKYYGAESITADLVSTVQALQRLSEEPYGYPKQTS